MARTLEISHLRTFVAIVEHGGFGRAATALHLAQSTVSQHVRGLERSVGRALVERDGRGARLTPAGEAALMHARRVLVAHDEARDALCRDRAAAPQPQLDSQAW